MTSHEEGLKMRHERLENEKQRYLKERQQHEDELFNGTEMSKEEEKLRKQHARLKNEKDFNKKHSYLTKDRRLSLPLGENPISKSCHAKSETTNVKSKLFDYTKSAPRSRRQLMGNEYTPSASPSLRVTAPMETHAMEVDKADWHSEIVNHLAIDPTHTTSSRQKSPKTSKSPLGRNSTLDKTDLEKKAAERSTSRIDQKVTFEAEHKHLDNHLYSRSHKYVRSPRPSIEIDRKDHDENAEKLKALYNKAIESVKHVDESLLLEEKHHPDNHKKERRTSDILHHSGLGLDVLRELETILKEARLYSSRKSSKEDHCRLDLGTNRAQKKRIEHLEEVLNLLNPTIKPSPEIDPMKTLQCSYLRLSKSNIETLENMIKQEGKDPGIHIHSDVTNYDIWKGIKEERTDMKDIKATTPNNTETKNIIKT